MPAFEATSAGCMVAADLPHLRTEAVALMDRGCILDGFMPPAPPPLLEMPPLDPRGGHRRTQGLLGLHHHTTSDQCPWDSFQDRAEAVNRACCYQDQGACVGGIPATCDDEV